MQTFVAGQQSDIAGREFAQLHLALASISYGCGDAGASQAEAEAVLTVGGLPACLYEAAEQWRILASLAYDRVQAPDRSRAGRSGTDGFLPASLVAHAAV